MARSVARAGLAVAAGVACVVALFITGCATTASRPLLDSAAKANLLMQLPGFAMTGRAGVRAGEDGVNATLEWTQRGEEASARLSGPFGAGNLAITWTPTALRIAGGDRIYEDQAAEQLLVEQLGFVPPFAALRYWVLGLQAPGEPPAEQGLGDDGRLQQLVQQQWRIRYDSWMRVTVQGQGVELPRRLVAARDDLRLTVVVRRWRL